MFHCETKGNDTKRNETKKEKKHQNPHCIHQSMFNMCANNTFLATLNKSETHIRRATPHSAYEWILDNNNACANDFWCDTTPSHNKNAFMAKTMYMYVAFPRFSFACETFGCNEHGETCVN